MVVCVYFGDRPPASQLSNSGFLDLLKRSVDPSARLLWWETPSSSAGLLTVALSVSPSTQDRIGLGVTQLLLKNLKNSYPYWPIRLVDVHIQREFFTARA